MDIKSLEELKKLLLELLNFRLSRDEFLYNEQLMKVIRIVSDEIYELKEK